MQSKCKYQKNNVKYSQYYHNPYQIFGNIGPMYKGIKVRVWSKNKNRDNDDNNNNNDGERSAGKMSSGAQLKKSKKRICALTNSNYK